MTNQRQLQVGEYVKRTIASSLQDMDFYSISLRGVHIMEVRMSSDLRSAKVYFHLAPGHGNEEKSKDEIVKILNKEVAPALQRRVSQESRLRSTPRLRFVVDDVVDQAWRVNDLLKRAMG